ncbi:hypothetical protein ACUND2_22465 [Serratia sp. IR-2025]
MGIRAVYDSATKTITDSVDTVGLLASASKRLAEVADNKAKRFSELVELKDQATYVASKAEIEQRLAALGVNLDGSKKTTK